MMVKRFRDVWKPDWTDRARSLNFSPRQIVTTASIIETEAKLAEERAAGRISDLQPLEKRHSARR